MSNSEICAGDTSIQ